MKKYLVVLMVILVGGVLFVGSFQSMAGSGEYISIKLTDAQVKAIQAGKGKPVKVKMTGAQKGAIQSKFPSVKIKLSEPTFASISLNSNQLVDNNQIIMTVVEVAVAVTAANPGDRISPLLFNPQPEPPIGKSKAGGQVRLTLTSTQVQSVLAAKGNNVSVQFTQAQIAEVFRGAPLDRLGGVGESKGVLAVTAQADQIGNGNMLALKCGKGSVFAFVAEMERQPQMIK